MEKKLAKGAGRLCVQAQGQHKRRMVVHKAKARQLHSPMLTACRPKQCKRQQLRGLRLSPGRVSHLLSLTCQGQAEQRQEVAGALSSCRTQQGGREPEGKVRPSLPPPPLTHSCPKEVGRQLGGEIPEPMGQRPSLWEEGVCKAIARASLQILTWNSACEWVLLSLRLGCTWGGGARGALC